MKSIILAGLLLGAAQGAHAGYVNVEANQAYTGPGELQSTVTDIHYGIEGASGAYSWYVQGGPQIQSLPEDDELVLSGKAGASIQAQENVSVYGELSFAGSDSYGAKAGLKWSFD